MAILARLSRSDIQRDFTHYGWFCGLVPVYLNNPDGGSPMMQERNWIPEAWLWTVTGLFNMFSGIASFLSDDYEAAFPLQITGKVHAEVAHEK